jgi:uncharacterized protein YkuJ
MTQTFSHILPYVYLGTAAPTASVNSSSNILKISGGVWNDQVLTLAHTAFAASADGWTVSDLAADATTLTATKEFTDFALSAVVKSSGWSYKIAVIEVTYTEAFNPANVPAAWPTEIMDHFTNDFGGDSVPVFYMGTKNPTLGYTYPQETDIKGGAWDDRIVGLATTALEADGWNVFSGKALSSLGYNPPSLTAWKIFDNGSVLRLKLYKYWDDNALLEVYYTQAPTLPTETAWEADTLTSIKAALGGNEVPFLASLGQADPSTSVDYSRHILSLDGSNKLSPKVVEDIKTDLEKEQDSEGKKVWTVTTTKAPYGEALSATKTVSNGTLTISIDAPTYISTYSSISMKVHFAETFKKPTETSDKVWPDDVKTVMTTNLSGYTIPYTYLGTMYPHAQYSSSYSSVVITGGTWNDSLYTDVAADMKASTDWNFVQGDDTTDDKGVKTIHLVGENKTSGDKMQVEFTKDSNGTPILTLTFFEKFEEPTEAADKQWSTTIQSDMTTKLGLTVLPYVYLGTKSPKETAQGSAQLTIEGGFWDDRIIDIAQKAFDADVTTDADGKTTKKKWETTVEQGSYSKVFGALQQLADGSLIRVVIRSNSSTNGKAVLYAYYSKKDTATTLTDWDDDEKSDFTDAVGADNVANLPFVDLGSGSYYSSSSTYNLPYAYVYSSQSSYSGSRSDANLYAAYKTYIEAGYSLVSMTINTGYYGPTYMVSKAVTGGALYVLFMANSSGNRMYVSYVPTFSAPTAENAKWDDKTKAVFDKSFSSATLGEEFSVPYVYLGKSDPRTTNSTSSGYTTVTVTGGAWNDTIFTEAETAFPSSAGWSFVYDYSNSYYGKTFVTTKKVKNGYVTVKVRKGETNDMGFAPAVMTVTFFPSAD